MTPIRKEANEAFKKFAPVPIDEKGCLLAGARWMAENIAEFAGLIDHVHPKVLSDMIRQLAKELSQ